MGWGLRDRCPVARNELEAKLARAEQELAEAKRDLENGFMPGAYARLKQLQDKERNLERAEQELEKLREANKSLKVRLQNAYVELEAALGEKGSK